MRLARKRAGWALTAAGTIGLTVAAAAQASHDQPLLVPQTTMPVAASFVMDGGFARVLEIRAELAWLADTHTFPYELAAHATGTTLEVGGMVPNGAIRDQALEVARAHCPLPVVDRLLIQPGAGNPPVKMGDANLCHAAGEALAKMLAGHNEPFQVAADPSGQITLLGTVPSCEEKLRISRRMSQLPGCTSVVNSMVVARAIRGGDIYTTVSLDGSIQVPGDPLDLLPPPTVTVPSAPVVVQGSRRHPSAASVSMVVEGQGYASAPASVGVIGVEAPLYPAQVSTMSEGRLHPMISAGTVVAQPMPQSGPIVTVSASSSEKTVMLAPQTRMVPVAARPIQPVVYQAPAPMIVAVPVSPYGGSVAPPVVKYMITPSPSPYAIRPPQPSPVPVMVAVAPAAPLPNRAGPTAPANGPIVLASATQVDSKPVDAKPAKPSFRPAKTAAPAKNAMTQPAATSVLDSKGESGKSAAKDTEPAKPLTPNQNHIKRLVEVACGDAARDVELKPIGNNRLVITLRVRSAGEGQRLGERILMMPELEPYKVDLDMEVKP